MSFPSLKDQQPPLHGIYCIIVHNIKSTIRIALHTMIQWDASRLKLRVRENLSMLGRES